MTAPSVLSSIIAALPDDDGRDIADQIGDAQPAVQAEGEHEPEPIRAIEYLLLRNRPLEWEIQARAGEAVEKGRHPDWPTATDQWQKIEQVAAYLNDILGIRSEAWWHEEDHKTSRGTTYKGGVSYIAISIDTSGFTFTHQYEFLEYIRTIPAPSCDECSDYDWRAIGLIEKPGVDMSDGQDWNWAPTYEQRPIVNCDQVRFMLLNRDGPHADNDDWPADDDRAGQLKAFEEWIRSTQPADIADRIQRWHAAGRNIELFKRLGRRRDRIAGAEQVEMLVDGLVPAGMVTLLVGAQEAGKSTAALELDVAVATGREEWLGCKINQERAKGVAVLLTGEDTDAVVNGRLSHLDPDDEARRLVVYALDGRPLPDILTEIRDMPNVSLIVVDPARRYLKGDEDGSANVDEFFASLDEIARHTRAAVLVLHHLRKDANPATLAQVREAVRGSSVFLDRPRVVLGCFRLKRDDVTVIGGIKSNLPPAYPIAGAIKLRRDAATLRHIPVQPEAVAEVDDVGERDELERKVLDALVRLTSRSERITRRGGRELWALHPPELEGVGRNRIREAVDQLLKDGVLVVGDAGVEVVP
jgi:hypothetical protein